MGVCVCVLQPLEFGGSLLTLEPHGFLHWDARPRLAIEMANEVVHLSPISPFQG